MWLYVPSVCSPAAAALTSASNSPVQGSSDPSATWNGKPMRPRSLPGILKKAPFLKRLSGLTCEPSALQTSALSWARRFREANSTCSPPDTPAPTSPTPASEQVWRAIEDSFGSAWLMRLSAINRPCFFSKMYRGTLLADSIPFANAWMAWVTDMRLACSLRRKLGQATRENGCSSWPTARVTDVQSGREVYINETGKFRRRSDNTKDEDFGANLSDTAEKLWPTASGEDAESCGNHPQANDSLTGMTKLWQTPTTPDRGPETKASKAKRPDAGGIDLQTEAKQWQTPSDPTFKYRKQVGQENRTEELLPAQATNWKTPHGCGNIDKTGKMGAGGEFAKQATHWPTPAARDHKSGEASPETMNKNARPLNEVACHSSLPDPPTSKPGDESSKSTPPSHQQWGTPRSSESAIYAETKETYQAREGGGKVNLADQACQHDTKKRLNPLFVEWLMGFPNNWTSAHNDSVSSEMPPCPSKQPTPLSALLLRFSTPDHEETI